MENYDKKMKNRLNRAKGQLQGVLRMMEDNKDCVDVVTQLSAVRTGLDRLIGVIVAENLKTCLETDAGNHDEKITQAIKMIVNK